MNKSKKEKLSEINWFGVIVIILSPFLCAVTLYPLFLFIDCWSFCGCGDQTLSEFIDTAEVVSLFLAGCVLIKIFDKLFIE